MYVCHVMHQKIEAKEKRAGETDIESTGGRVVAISEQGSRAEWGCGGVGSVRVCGKRDIQRDGV